MWINALSTYYVVGNHTVTSCFFNKSKYILTSLVNTVQHVTLSGVTKGHAFSEEWKRTLNTCDSVRLTAASLLVTEPQSKALNNTSTPNIQLTSLRWGPHSWGGTWAQSHLRFSLSAARDAPCNTGPTLPEWQTSPHHKGHSSLLCFGF